MNRFFQYCFKSIQRFVRGRIDVMITHLMCLFFVIMNAAVCVCYSRQRDLSAKHNQMFAMCNRDLWQDKTVELNVSIIHSLDTATVKWRHLDRLHTPLIQGVPRRMYYRYVTFDLLHTVAKVG